MCVCVHVSVVSLQAAWGQDRPDGYYANEASCLLHWQTLHNALLVLLEVRKYCICIHHILSPLFFLRGDISTYSNFIICLTIHLYHCSNEWESREGFLKQLLTSTVCSKLCWGSKSIHSSKKQFPMNRSHITSDTVHPTFVASTTSFQTVKIFFLSPSSSLPSYFTSLLTCDSLQALKSKKHVCTMLHVWK